MIDTIAELFVRYGAWSWWLLGFLLLGLELAMPGFVLLWFGVAALVVGVLALTVHWSIQTLALIWAATSIVLLVAGRTWFRRTAPQATDDPLLNDRGGRLVGRIFTLAEPLGENGGHLAIDDGMWRITGPLLPAGTRVVVRAVDGNLLIVEAAPD
ncbi:NfeD family protein [Siculibacillus lacustris]|uniref:NfeD family protein n=1 Tax=Siculibacillus lacustris TaxID=1549641 RepID=A0A4Q9VWP3_9HYPH|nr:NfeD family protein [Siculibacillus lacustris]TBW40752.1 NfeD family protein [Siculibacillus lacustris]